VSVSQRFIDLLRLPVARLRHLADAKGFDLPGDATHWDLARQLSHLPRSDIEEGSQGFLYAGSSSLSWFRLAEGEGPQEDDPDAYHAITGESIESEAIETALRSISEHDPFSETERPSMVTKSPTLVVAMERDDGVYLLNFAVARRVTRVIHNFESQEVLEDQFFVAVVRPADGVVEVRTNAGMARTFQRTWLTEFAMLLEREAVPVAISQADYLRLRDELRARLDVYTGTDAIGTSAIGTVRFSKADAVDDLLEEEEFVRATAGRELLSGDLLFDDPSVGEVRALVSRLNGSVFVRTAVPEAVVGRVYAALKSVKSG
jgi:hypothetical protein